jgi:hypothetical protein
LAPECKSCVGVAAALGLVIPSKEGAAQAKGRKAVMTEEKQPTITQARQQVVEAVEQKEPAEREKPVMSILPKLTGREEYVVISESEGVPELEEGCGHEAGLCVPMEEGTRSILDVAVSKTKAEILDWMSTFTDDFIIKMGLDATCERKKGLVGFG